MTNNDKHRLISTICTGYEKIMESDCEFIDLVGDLLVVAAQEGDFSASQSCLATVSNPTTYINRLYDGENPIKRTLLTIACTQGHEDFVREFLSHHKPDLEVSNVVELDPILYGQAVFYGVSALWVAAALNNLEIVKLLVEHGARVNHVTPTNSTAVRCACWHGNMDMVRYLVAKGGDIRIAREHNETNLLAGVSRKHLNVVTYLVDEVGFDVNECNTKGRSPLYEAAKSCSLEIAQFLLDRGARNFPSSHSPMSPLMWAAEKLQTEIFDAILPHCSMLERIEGTELFGSALICYGREDDVLERAFEYFSRALDLRAQHDLPKRLKQTTTEIFGNRQECGTIAQLEAIRSSRDDLCIEAMLVRERVLGPTNEEYMDSIRYNGAVLADRGDFDRAVPLWLYDLQLRIQRGLPIEREILRSFPDIFSQMLIVTLWPSINALETVIAVTVENLALDSKEFDHYLHTLLFLITIASQVSDFHMTLSFDMACSHRSWCNQTSHLQIEERSIDSSTRSINALMSAERTDHLFCI